MDSMEVKATSIENYDFCCSKFKDFSAKQHYFKKYERKKKLKEIVVKRKKATK